MSPVNLSFSFNMTDATSVTFLSPRWTVRNNGLYFRQQPMIRSDIYMTFGVNLQNKPKNAKLYSTVVCKATRPSFNVSIPSPIDRSNSLFAGAKGNTPAGNVTFKKLTKKTSCCYYPWDPLFDPLAKPAFCEANCSTRWDPQWCILLPNKTHMTS